MTLVHKRAALSWSVTREMFEARAQPLLARLRAPVERAIRDARLRPDQISHLVLAGGATRMPMVRRLAAQLFDRFPVASVDPDEVVARGAAVQAGLVAEDAALSDRVMTDVAPFTLGVEVSKGRDSTLLLDGLFSPLIERNTVIPASRSTSLTVVRDYQKSITLKVYQGEGRLVRDNIFLGELAVPIPPDKAGAQPVEVRFTYARPAGSGADRGRAGRPVGLAGRHRHLRVLGWRGRGTSSASRRRRTLRRSGAPTRHGWRRRAPTPTRRASRACAKRTSGRWPRPGPTPRPQRRRSLHRSGRQRPPRRARSGRSGRGRRAMSPIRWRITMAQDRSLPADAVGAAAGQLGWPDGAVAAAWAGALRTRLDAERWLDALRREAASPARWLGAATPITSRILLGRGRLGVSRIMVNDPRLRRRYGEYLLHAPVAGGRFDPVRVEAIGRALRRRPGRRLTRVLNLMTSALMAWAAGEMAAEVDPRLQDGVTGAVALVLVLVLSNERRRARLYRLLVRWTRG